MEEDRELQAYLNELSSDGTGPNGGIGRVSLLFQKKKKIAKTDTFRTYFNSQDFFSLSSLPSDPSFSSHNLKRKLGLCWDMSRNQRNQRFKSFTAFYFDFVSTPTIVNM